MTKEEIEKQNREAEWVDGVSLIINPAHWDYIWKNGSEKIKQVMKRHCFISIYIPSTTVLRIDGLYKGRPK